MPAVKKTVEKILTWEDIENADDLPTELVACPEWGGSVRIRALSRKRAVSTLEECQDSETGVMDAVKLQMLCVLRGVVEPPLTDDRFAQLNEKHPDPIQRICDRVQVISGMREDAVDKAAAQFRGDS